MFNPDLHAAHASCEEGEFTYDETTEEAKRQKIYRLSCWIHGLWCVNNK